MHPFSARSRRGFAATLLCASALVACGDEPTVIDGAPDEGATDASVDPNDVDALRSLGYAGVGDALDEDAATGVTHFDRARASAGINLFTNAHLSSTQLLTMDGDVVHEWSHPASFRWGNAILMPDGDLVVVGRLPHDGSPEEARAGRYLARLDWNGDTLWQTAISAHHDVELTPNGQLLTMTYALREIPTVHKSVPLVDNSLALVSLDGEVLEELSMWDVMTSDASVFTPQEVKPGSFDRAQGVDALHLNAAEWVRGDALRERGMRLDDDTVLVCFRHQDTVALIDWSERRVLWAWGQGELSGPHDVTLLANGNLLLFDNGLDRKWSRVVEVDPIARAIVWEYAAPERERMFSITRGSNQRLANGNTLIADSDSGRVFEVTTGGEIVWEFQNFNLTEKREPSVIVRMRRFEGLDYAALAARVQAGSVPFVD